MSTKMSPAARKLQRLTRILEALELELLEASDEEILEAAKELGMDPRMKGSAAFLGLKYGTRRQAEEFLVLMRAHVDRMARAKLLGIVGDDEVSPRRPFDFDWFRRSRKEDE